MPHKAAAHKPPPPPPHTHAAGLACSLISPSWARTANTPVCAAAAPGHKKTLHRQLAPSKAKAALHTFAHHYHRITSHALAAGPADCPPDEAQWRWQRGCQKQQPAALPARGVWRVLVATAPYWQGLHSTASSLVLAVAVLGVTGVKAATSLSSCSQAAVAQSVLPAPSCVAESASAAGVPACRLSAASVASSLTLRQK